MGHRVNTVVTKRTIGFKISSDQKDIPEVTETNKQSLLRPVERPQEVVKLETEAVLSRLTVFPSYSVLFREAQSAIFADNGPLPVSTRHYIAWMVSLSFYKALNVSKYYIYQSARVAGCSPLASLEQSLFLASGGSQDWLPSSSSSSSSKPAKLVRLEEINVILCKTPRLLTSEHIKVENKICQVETL